VNPDKPKEETQETGQSAAAQPEANQPAANQPAAAPELTEE